MIINKGFFLIPLVAAFLLANCKGGQDSNDLAAGEGEVNQVEALFPNLWTDDFDTLDAQFWTIGLRDNISGDLVPGAHGDHLLNKQYDGYYIPENVYIEDGQLVLRNQKEAYKGISPEGDFNYTSGWVMSMHKVFFNEGYIEIRAKFPSGEKVWPAFWLIPEDLTWCPEWDLFEYFGYRSDVGSDQMGMHLCSSAYPDVQWSDYYISDYDKTYDCEEWHTYGFLWTSTHATWYIDGKEVRNLLAEGIPDWPSKPMYIVLNNGTRTESPEGTTQWPNYFTIDYLKLRTR